MAYNARNFVLAGPSGNGNSGRIWRYKTEDAVGTSAGQLGSAGYFNDAASKLQLGDIIQYTVVTNQGASNEAVTAAGVYVVLTISGAGAVGLSPANARTIA